MASSLRKYLLINLLCGITTIMIISTIANYYLDRNTIGRHLDTWLSHSAFILQAMLSDDVKKLDVQKLQKALNQCPEQMQKFYHGNTKQAADFYSSTSKLQFQVFDKQHNLILHSAIAPKQPLSDGSPGFSQRTFDNQPWQVFTISQTPNNLTIMTGERLDIRRELGKRIQRDAIIILLLTYPLFGLVIWFTTGRSMNSIQRVAKEVGHRAPNFLNPVDLQSVPLEIKPLVDELNKLFLRIRQGFEREKSFSANAAHELRTPLAALKTQVQVALKSTDEERNAALDKLLTSVDRASHVVQQLLTLSRLVPDVILQGVAPFNLSKLTTEVVATIAPQAIDKNIEIELIGGDSQIFISGIATAISILLRNLIDNAIRYTPEGGIVQIYIEKQENQHHVLRVIDNGPGIPAELRSQVFERFYRILGNKCSGSGLGLAIVQQIATLHKAVVILGSAASGKGLEVIVDFGRYDN